MHSAVSPRSLAPLALGWVSVVALALFRPDPAALSLPVTFAWLGAIITVIIVCAFGVLAHAEELAHRLGDPYGTLVLTLSIVSIEVVLIAAVLLGPGTHATVARDATLSAFVLFIALFLGMAILVATLRNGPLRLNRDGMSAYLTMLITFSAIAFAVPGLIGRDGAYVGAQAVFFIVITIAAYAFFLWQQIGPRAHSFQEVEQVSTREGTVASSSATWVHGLLLFVTAAAIVVLSHDMAGLMDAGLARTAAPEALSGLVIAAIVMLPEALTTLRAAWFGEMQRVSNLTHGAIVSVMCLTIPTVLIIGLLTGETMVFAESGTNLTLIGLVLAVSMAMLGARRVTPLHGLVLLLLGGIYLVALFTT